ncbi:hypothetical protein ACFLZB_03580 [Nanoarchaeota archaeon]
MADEMDDLKKLSPEERLAKLKEIEEKSKKEIAEAQKLIQESEGEIEEKKKFEDKVPIPQLIAHENISLEAKEEKEMFDSQRQKGKGKEDVSELKEKSLEDQLRSEHIEELSRRPADELKERMADIYKRAGEQDGYMTSEQKGEVYNIAKAEGEKIYAMQEGNYPAEQIGNALENISATFAMTKRLRSMYEAKGDDTGSSPGGAYK